MAFAWAVDPLAFSVCFPPQLTFADDPAEDPDEDPDEAPDAAPDGAPLAFTLPFVSLLFPHADNISAPVANALSAAPNRLILKIFPLNSRGDDYFHCANRSGWTTG
jgi:hypothetical protein